MKIFESNTDVLTELVSLDSKRVLDIGAGDGAMVRFMTGAGATVVGLECGIEQLDTARSTAMVGNERYMQGVGEALPFDNDTFDLATFFLSLHHVPEASMDVALQEAARVVSSNGLVYVAEPLAEGSGFEVHAPIDDETYVRQKAITAMQAAGKFGLVEIELRYYNTHYHYASFADYKDQLIRIDPSRAAPFAVIESDLRVLFDRLGERCKEGTRFHQPMRVNLFRKQ